jgi:hypothetical protein
MTALPLGQLPGGAALLRVASVDSASGLALSALDGTGQVLWSIDIDRLAKPVNGVLDSHTGDLVGFTDLTGDAIPDVGVAVQKASGLAVQAIDGLTGEIAWESTLSDVQQIVPVLIDEVSGAAAAAGGQASSALAAAAGAVQQVRAGATTALLALGTSATGATLSLIDPLTGAVQWTTTAAVPLGSGLVGLSADLAGDLDGDGKQDLLVTAAFDSSGSASTAQDKTAGGMRSASAAGDSTSSAGSVTAVSGDSGQTLYAASAEPTGPNALEFGSDAGPAASSEQAGDDNGNAIPGPGLFSLGAALALGVLWRRRRSA